jgi:hypothetical protein
MNAEQLHEDRDVATLYFNRREDYFLVAAEAKQGYGRTEVGEPVKITGDQFEKRIGEILSQALDSFQGNSPSDQLRRQPGEYQAFRRKHLSISVERQRSSGELRIMPCHRIQGGYAGKRTEEIVLSAQEVPMKLPTVIRKAFDIAT